MLDIRVTDWDIDAMFASAAAPTDPPNVYVVTYADGHTVECMGTDPVDAGQRASRTYPGVAYTVTPNPVRTMRAS